MEMYVLKTCKQASERGFNKVRIDGVVYTAYDAIGKSFESGLDLVIVNDSVYPAIGKLMDFSKYQYDQKKRDKENIKRQKSMEKRDKEVKFHLNIGQADRTRKFEQVREFLDDNCRVKITLFLIGRERGNRETAMDFVNGLMDETRGLNVARIGKIQDSQKTISFTVER